MKLNKQVTNELHLLAVEIKDYNVLIDGEKIFYQPVKNNLKAYNDIQEIAIGQGGDYTAACLPEYNYFDICYKMIAAEIGKRQALDANSKAVQQINFTGNLENNAVIYFPLLKKQKKLFYIFHKEL